MSEINITNSNTELLFQFLQDNGNIQELLEVANVFLKLSSREHEYAIKICDKIHLLLHNKFQQQSKTQDILSQERGFLAKVNEIIPKDRTEEHLQLTDIIKYNREFQQKFPSTLKWTFTTFQKNFSEASLIMLECAFKIYQDSIKANTSSPVLNNNNKMDVDGDKDNDEELLESFNKTLERSLSAISLPDKGMEISKFLKEKNFGVICAKSCQTVAKKIKEQRERSKALVFKSTLDLDGISLQLFETGLDAIFQNLSNLESKAKINANNLSYRDMKDLAILQGGDLLKSYIEFMIPEYLENPDFIIKIGNKLLDLKQYNHVILVAERARIRLDTLQKEQSERLKLSKKIKDLKVDIESIKKVGGYPSKQLEELVQLESVERVNTVLPNYVFIDNKRYSEFILSIAKLRIKSILEMKEATKGANQDVQEQLEKTLDTIIDPNHIFELAVLLESKKESDIALKYGERCQKFISDLEKLRDIRLPLQNHLDTLTDEEKNLRTAGKTLTKAKQDQMQKLHEQIDALPEWPHFGELRVRHQYDNLNLQVVQVMINCVLENKKKFESSKDKALKQSINNQIDHLVKMCLEKFQDPIYLLKFAKHMRSSNEDKVLVQVVTQIFKRVIEIEEKRVQRLTLTKKLEGIVDQMKKQASPNQFAEFEKQKKQIDSEIEALPQWPHYAKLDASNQYDQTKLESATILMISLLDGVSFIEEKIRKKKLFNLKNVGEDEDLTNEKNQLNKSIDQSLEVCLSNIENPESICQFANEIGTKRESLFIKISNIFHPKLKEYYQKAVEFKQSDILIEILNQEFTELTRMKKDIPDEDIKLLEATKLKNKDVNLPFIEQYLSCHTLHSKMITQAIKLVYQFKSNVITKSSNGEISQTELPELLAKSKEQIQNVFQNVKFYLEDPTSYQNILKELLQKKEYSKVNEFGKLVFGKLNEFKKIQDESNANLAKKKLLDEEKDLFAKQRRRLPSEKALEYRQTLLKERVDNLLPQFIRSNLNQICLSFAEIIIGSASQEKTEFENSLHLMNAEDDIKNISTQRKKFVKNIEDTVKFCVKHIHSLETLLSFSQSLYAKREFNLVLQVGKVIEDILEGKKQVIEQKEDLEKEIKQLQQKYLHSTDLQKREKIQKSIDETQKTYESIIPTHTYDMIKSLTLEITKIMIESANVEDQGEILRAQIILSFKIDATSEKWDQIRNLSSEDEWQATKKELVGFVMKREENINSKLELLMIDGLFEECIEIFPHPSLEDDELTKQLEILINLYSRVEQRSLNLLPLVMPLVHKYAKRCYQEWKPERLDPVFDLVQKRFPNEIKEMFEKATEMLLVNILQSQYPIFLGMLKNFKRRMVVTLGLQSHWDSFLETFKKTHKGKKRLIQMVNFIGDSVWNIESPNPGQSDSKSSKRSSKRAKPTTIAVKAPNILPTTFGFQGSYPMSVPNLPNPPAFSFPASNLLPKLQTPKQAPKKIDSDKDSDTDEDEDEDEVDSMKVDKKPLKSAKKPKNDDSGDDEPVKKTKKKKMDDSSDEDSASPKKKKAIPMKKKKSKDSSSESDSSDSESEKKSTKKSAKKPAKKVVSSSSSSSESESSESESEKKSPKKPAKELPKKRKIEKSLESTDEDEPTSDYDKDEQEKDFEEDDE